MFVLRISDEFFEVLFDDTIWRRTKLQLLSLFSTRWFHQSQIPNLQKNLTNISMIAFSTGKLWKKTLLRSWTNKTDFFFLFSMNSKRPILYLSVVFNKTPPYVRIIYNSTLVIIDVPSVQRGCSELFSFQRHTWHICGQEKQKVYGSSVHITYIYPKVHKEQGMCQF